MKQDRSILPFPGHGARETFRDRHPRWKKVDGVFWKVLVGGGAFTGILTFVEKYDYALLFLKGTGIVFLVYLLVYVFHRLLDHIRNDRNLHQHMQFQEINSRILLLILLPEDRKRFEELSNKFRRMHPENLETYLHYFYRELENELPHIFKKLPTNNPDFQ